ncbi:MAG: tRNA pseudouridine(55) synthase TruB [Bacteroidia bacterium]|nr:tRNA pseudouridine(55) synthase TruB [Bacteroidia bacterium]
MIIVDKNSDPDKIDYREGAVILINKDLHWTSFDVVNKIRFALRSRYQIKKIKVGHNGTLDPLASGLLMIFTGKYTKRIPYEENHDKYYEGLIKLGATTDTLDTEMPETDFTDYKHVDESMIQNAMESFLGDSMQEIPVFSATKTKGQRMYKLAREGKEIEKKFKAVTFHEITMDSYKPPIINFSLKCGKGTYVRAFARDLGIKLKTTAYLYALKRTGIANYSIENAFNVETFCSLINHQD